MTLEINFGTWSNCCSILTSIHFQSKGPKKFTNPWLSFLFSSSETSTSTIRSQPHPSQQISFPSSTSSKSDVFRRLVPTTFNIPFSNQHRRIQMPRNSRAKSTHTSPMASSVLYHITVRVTDTRTSRTAFDPSVYLWRDANEEMEFQGKTDSAGRIHKWSYRPFGGAYGTTWSIPGMMEYFLRGWWSLEFLIGDYFQEEKTCGQRC